MESEAHNLVRVTRAEGKTIEDAVKELKKLGHGNLKKKHEELGVSYEYRREDFGRICKRTKRKDFRVESLNFCCKIKREVSFAF